MTTASPPSKRPQTASTLEFVGGVFGLLGLGYLYAGRTQQGIAHFVSWVVWIVVACTVINLLPSRIVAVLICLPLYLFIQVAVPFMFARRLKREMTTISVTE